MVTKIANWLDRYKGTFVITSSPDWPTHHEVMLQWHCGGSSNPYWVVGSVAGSLRQIKK
jgi:hypothetical protein